MKTIGEILDTWDREGLRYELINGYEKPFGSCKKESFRVNVSVIERSDVHVTGNSLFDVLSQADRKAKYLVSKLMSEREKRSKIKFRKNQVWRGCGPENSFVRHVVQIARGNKEFEPRIKLRVLNGVYVRCKWTTESAFRKWVLLNNANLDKSESRYVRVLTP